MNKFSCQDISLASYLKSCGEIIEDLVRENNYCLFVFENYNRCSKLAINFWNSQAIGNIKQYEEAKQTLISMVKNKR